MIILIISKLSHL